MLFERRKSTSNNENSNIENDGVNSAGKTARTCSSELKLRTACYCEENVWRLAYRRLKGPLEQSGKDDDTASSMGGKENEEYYVVFISNDGRCCPMLNQLASGNPKKPCFWDYHVILLKSSKVVKKGKTVIEAQILDMDSHLPFPCALEEYLDGTFEMHFADEDDAKNYAPLFRVIRAEIYLQEFYSDRMHMMKDGKWLAKPPSYECITAPNMKKNKEGHLSNLDDYIAMRKGKKGKSQGEVYTLQEFRKKFGLG